MLENVILNVLLFETVTKVVCDCQLPSWRFVLFLCLCSLDPAAGVLMTLLVMYVDWKQWGMSIR